MLIIAYAQRFVNRFYKKKRPTGVFVLFLLDNRPIGRLFASYKKQASQAFADKRQLFKPVGQTAFCDTKSCGQGGKCVVGIVKTGNGDLL